MQPVRLDLCIATSTTSIKLSLQFNRKITNFPTTHKLIENPEGSFISGEKIVEKLLKFLELQAPIEEELTLGRYDPSFPLVRLK